MNVAGFREALRAIHPSATVEANGRIAIVGMDDPRLDAQSRRRIVALAREHGFSNVAIELLADARLPGDPSAR